MSPPSMWKSPWQQKRIWLQFWCLDLLILNIFWYLLADFVCLLCCDLANMCVEKTEDILQFNNNLSHPECRLCTSIERVKQIFLHFVVEKRRLSIYLTGRYYRQTRTYKLGGFYTCESICYFISSYPDASVRIWHIHVPLYYIFTMIQNFHRKLLSVKLYCNMYIFAQLSIKQLV